VTRGLQAAPPGFVQSWLDSREVKPYGHGPKVLLVTPTTLQEKTVLVVEDDPWTRTVLTALLAGEGFGVLEAKTGEAGLRLASQHCPDAVMLDLALPTLSGLEVLRELKRGIRTAEIPVIVVSAYATLMGAPDTQLADAVIEKPFDYDDVIGHLERLTRRSPATVGHR
jgi:two-component system, OmpR family, phosphate regulon response regulator PhoB